MGSELREALVEILREELGGNKSMNESDIWRFGQKHDSSVAGIGVGYAHGPGGLMTFPGVDPDVFSTMIGTLGGVFSQLPTLGSVYTNPVYELMTGVYGPSGSVMQLPCDDAPVAGLMKAGKHSAPFGRISYQTRAIDLTRVGKRNDRADPVDLRLRNMVTGPAWMKPNGAGIFNNELSKALFERAIAFQRKLAQLLFTGNSTNNTGGGGYKEFNGFDKLIATGYVDAETNVALPSVDSYVSNANHLRIDSNTSLLLRYLSDMIRQAVTRADRMGLSPVRWVLAMREEAFWAITEVFPCAYYLGGCNVQTANGTNVNIDAKSAVDLRDQMRAQKYLIVDGVKYDVVIDDGITEDSNTTQTGVPSGCFESDIYFIPMSVLGGAAVTFFEYFDYTNSDANGIMGDNLILARSVANGMFLETPKQTNACFQLQATIEPRLVMRTPWLASRLQNVVYCPVQHTRDPFPESAYFANGGATNRVGAGPSYWGD